MSAEEKTVPARLLFIARYFSQGKPTPALRRHPQLFPTHGLEMQRYLVKPTEPTILSHKEYHEVSSINLLLSWTVSLQLQNDIRGATLTPTREQVPTSNVVPEILDIERFNVALSKTLSSFPHIAGRLVRPDTPDAPWKVRSRFISSLALSSPRSVDSVDEFGRPRIPHR